MTHAFAIGFRKLIPFRKRVKVIPAFIIKFVRNLCDENYVRGVFFLLLVMLSLSLLTSVIEIQA